MDDEDIDEAYRLFTEKRDVYGYDEATAFRDALRETTGGEMFYGDDGMPFFTVNGGRVHMVAQADFDPMRDATFSATTS
jgi:hypothetical protein